VSSVDAKHRRSQGLEDHVSVDQLLEERGIDAAAFEGVGPASKGFDVLPRHRLLPQPCGFEGSTHKPQRMEGSAQGQVVLYSKEAPVSQPNTLVDVALEPRPTATTLAAQTCADQANLVSS
jgi:hypothetical protein